MNDPPTDRAPSRFELQAIDSVRYPSSGSSAKPLKSTGSPAKTLAPSAGCRMLTVGAWFTVTVIVRIWLPSRLPESITEAVITWAPTESVDVENEPPVGPK